MSQIFKRFRHDVAAIGFLGIGLFLALALASYNPQDPSFNSIGQGLRATNYCGVVGSFLADLLLQAFGLSSWVIVLGLGKLGVDVFRGEGFSLKDTRYLWATLLVICSATLLNLYFPLTKLYSEQIYIGGLLGLGLSQGLVSALNSVGAQVVLWSAMLLLTVFFFERSLQELTETPRSLLDRLQSVPWKKIFNFKLDSIRKDSSKKTKSIPFFPLGEEKFVESGKQLPLKPQKNNEAVKAEEIEEEELELQEEDSSEEDLDVDDEDTSEDDGEEETPAIRLAAKRKVILKVKPPRRVANWQMPKLSLLEDPPASRVKIDKSEIQRKADLLVDKLKNFSIEGQIVDAKPGPLVTMYEFKPNADVKISKISELEDDLSLALSSESVRVVGHIPGTDVVGIETSNLKRETVYYKDLVAEPTFWQEDVALPMAIGRQVDGKPKVVDLRKMPHLLIAGTTGSGKSVLTGSIITGLLFRHSPKTLRLILIDPKMVDLAPFSEVPHLILPHITEPKKAASALKWAVREMEKRYRSLSKFGAGKIEVFNEKIADLSKEDIEQHEQINTDFEDNRQRNETYYYQPLPYIVIVVDELADLMIVEKQNIEEPIQRLTQKARACGIHIILATQSPRKDVVTGLIKTNIPGRIALKVASKMDSRIIIDDSGAERMLPNGDMLFLAPGVGKPTRHHGPYVSDKEISNVVTFWSKQAEPEFDPAGLKALEGFSGEGAEAGAGGAGGEGFSEEAYDERYDEILSWTSDQKEVSASLIQRKFRLGYPRAARIIEIFEKEGVVGPANGSKPRQVLVNSYKET
ncbi:MAG: DNA translocase FtsK [Bdellovibrionia bacterium]